MKRPCGVAELPAPKGYEGSVKLADVRETTGRDGRIIIAASPEARKLHTLGCIERYKL